MELRPVNTRAVAEHLVRFLAETFRGKRYSGAVLGLSGGIDSAVAAALCARALDPANVLAALLPATTTSPEAMADARRFGQSLAIRLVEVPVGPQMDLYFSRFPEADAKRRGNKTARERMSVLYDLSEAHHCLVVGTGNRSELLLGYGTLHGDMACAVNPLGGLFKTEVRQLAAELDIPREIRDRPPSADLWPGQTDEGELGFTYRDADLILSCLTDREMDAGQAAVATGLPVRAVEAVAARMAANEFKRCPAVIAVVPDEVKYG